MASIQQSLNNLFAASLGAGFAITQSPGVKEMAAQRAQTKELQKDVEYFGAETESAAEALNKIDRENFTEEDIAAGEAYLSRLEDISNKYYAASTQLRRPGALEKHLARARSIENDRLALEERKELLAKRQAEALEAKKGVQEAVAERRSVIEQLRAAGVNVDKVKGITDTKTGERVK